MLRAKYGVPNVTESDGGDAITVTLDGAVAIIDLETLVSLKFDDLICDFIQTCLQWVGWALGGLSEAFGLAFLKHRWFGTSGDYDVGGH